MFHVTLYVRFNKSSILLPGIPGTRYVLLVIDNIWYEWRKFEKSTPGVRHLDDNRIPLRGSLALADHRRARTRDGAFRERYGGSNRRERATERFWEGLGGWRARDMGGLQNDLAGLSGREIFCCSIPGT